MPAHFSHLLQPLDVSCFAFLKQLYGYQIEQYMQNGVNHIDKADFLTSYYQACMKTFKSETICNGFKITELVLYNPIQVLSQLHVEMRTPIPPGSSHSSQSSHWVPETLYNIHQLQYQSTVIRGYLQHHMTSPLSSTNQVLNQLVKDCQMAMHNAVLLINKNAALHTENQKQKQKQLKSAVFIAQRGILTVQEGQNHTQLA